jgi:hypothetical protein
MDSADLGQAMGESSQDSYIRKLENKINITYNNLNNLINYLISKGIVTNIRRTDD